MPNELESYAVTLLKAILGVKDLPANATPEQRAIAHKRQIEIFTELVTFLLDHYLAAGFTGSTIGYALLQAVRRWAREHLTTR